MYTFNSLTAASDARAYFRGMNLTAGEQVTVEFKTRLLRLHQMFLNQFLSI